VPGVLLEYQQGNLHNEEHRELQRRDIVRRFTLVWVVLVLGSSGCATSQARVAASDVESVAKGNRVTLLVLGTGNKWATRTEPDLYVVVEAPHPTPAEKVQTDLSECQAAARAVWNSNATERDRTILASEGPAYNPGAQVSRAAMELLARTYENCLQPKGYMVSRSDPRG
jgi:hypothetical protein